MSKTFVANGTGNQQTLSELDSDKIPVYSTEADLDADLANLEVGQIVATKDTGSELSAPVDTVQSGNMHAVTSNAVAEKFITGVITVNVETGTRQFDVQFPKTYQNKPLVFANIYDSTVSPYTEITGVNIVNVTTQGCGLRVHNSYNSAINNVKIAWLAISQD